MSKLEVIHALQEMLRCNGIEEGGFNESERSILQEALSLIENEDCISKLLVREKLYEEMKTRSELGYKTYIKREDMIREDSFIYGKETALRELLGEKI